MHISKHEKTFTSEFIVQKKDVQLSIKNYEADEKARKKLQKKKDTNHQSSMPNLAMTLMLELSNKEF